MIDKMAFLNKKICIRMNSESEKALKSILERLPYKYNNKSHIIRCAIIELSNKLKDKQNGKT